MTIILTALGFLKRIPWQIWLAIGAAIALSFAYHRGYSGAEADMQAVQAKVDRKALETARAADSAANVAVDATRNEVEQANDNARAAASSDPDPLGAGLRSLRTR